MAYALPSICWTAVALVALYMAGGLEKIRSWTNKRITLMGLLVAASQILILTYAGLISKFGKSPFSFTTVGIIINFILVSSTLLGMELSRAYLTKNLSRKNPTLTLAIVTFLYTFANVSIRTLINFQDRFTYTEFMGENFLPILTENLLATYLALLSGPVASLAYLAPLRAFQWFSPILPDLPWGYKVLIGVLSPTIGFITIDMATTQKDQKKAGIPTQRPVPRLRKSKTSMKGWMAISVFMVLTVWASTGLLGFFPTIIASGSMRPTMDVGDIAIVISTDPSEIQVGDVIQYWHETEMILHRVHNIHEKGGQRLFVTKGDANTAPDLDPVFSTQIQGKLVFNIPKLGWISIYAKTAIASIWSFFSTNITLAYVTLGIVALVGSTYSICAYKNGPHKYWKRKRGW